MTDRNSCDPKRCTSKNCKRPLCAAAAAMMPAEPAGDGIDRRGFLKCMAWVGTGVLWSMSSGGVLTSRTFGADLPAATQPTGGGAGAATFTFAQISDSHIGFAKEPNKDVVGTLQRAVDKMNALAVRPDLLIHTGDLTHLAKPEEFDTVAQVLKSAN